MAHDPTSFDCDNDALNRFIKLHALPGQRAGISQTYVAAVGSDIAGYHTLVVGDVTCVFAPSLFAGVAEGSTILLAAEATALFGRGVATRLGGGFLRCAPSFR